MIGKILFIIIFILGTTALTCALLGTIFTVIGVERSNTQSSNIERSDSFSFLAGSEKLIRFPIPSESCKAITSTNLSPAPAYAKIISNLPSVKEHKTEPVILSDHILKVGFNPNKPTYYGLPVEYGDRVVLRARPSPLNTAILRRVDISVYDSNGFSLLSLTSPLRIYTMSQSCLHSNSCSVSINTGYEGSVYLVVTSSPSPLDLVVSLSATVRSYTSSKSSKDRGCTIKYNSKCTLSTPIQVTRGPNIDGKKSYDTKLLPFALIYGNTIELPIRAEAAQSLDFSNNIHWECEGGIQLYIVGIVFLASFACCTVTCGIFSGISYFIIAQKKKKTPKSKKSKQSNQQTAQNTQDGDAPPTYPRDNVTTQKIELPSYSDVFLSNLAGNNVQV